MSNQLVELPIYIKLDEKYFPPNSNNDQAQIMLTATNNIESSTYTLPAVNSIGVLTNNGTGHLSWDVSSSTAVDTVTKNDALTNGTFKIIQNGTGDSDIRMTTPADSYMIGIDQSASAFKIARSASLGTDDILIMDDIQTILTKNSATDIALLMVRQQGAGDASINIKNTATATDYTLGLDSSDITNPNSFKISRSSVVGTNDMLIINPTDVKVGPSANLLTITTTQTTLGAPSNTMTITNTQTTIGPSSMITATSSNVTLGPSSALQTSSTQVNIAKNLILPDTATNGTAGVLKLGTCYFGNIDSRNNLLIGENTNYYNATGTNNLSIGLWCGSELSTGSYNTFIGQVAGEWTSTGTRNTFIGHSAGDQNSTGNYNTFVGESAGYNNTIGADNVCIGFQSGANLLNTSKNTLIGSNAGLNINADNNTLIGYGAGYNSSGADNTAMGAWAGTNVSTGIQNTMVGKSAGYTNTIGLNNEYFGFESGYLNVDGSENVGIGTKALRANNGGSGNVALGTAALSLIGYSDYNIAIGQYAGQNIDGSDNILIGRTDGVSVYTEMATTIMIGRNILNTVAKNTTDCIFIGNDISIADGTFVDRVCIGHGSTCTVDNGFVLGGASTLVGIRNNTPTQPLDVVGNVQTTGQLILVPQAVPGTPVLGGMYYDSGSNKLQVCTGLGPTVWKTISFDP